MKANRPIHATRHIAAVLGVALASLFAGRARRARPRSRAFGSAASRPCRSGTPTRYADEVARHSGRQDRRPRDRALVRRDPLGLRSRPAPVGRLPRARPSVTRVASRRTSTGADDEGFALALQPDGRSLRRARRPDRSRSPATCPTARPTRPSTTTVGCCLDLGVEAQGSRPRDPGQRQDRRRDQRQLDLLGRPARAEPAPLNKAFGVRRHRDRGLLGRQQRRGSSRCTRRRGVASCSADSSYPVGWDDARSIGASPASTVGAARSTPDSETAV